jgi:hypothetical protein
VPIVSAGLPRAWGSRVSLTGQKLQNPGRILTTFATLARLPEAEGDMTWKSAFRPPPVSGRGCWLAVFTTAGVFGFMSAIGTPREAAVGGTLALLFGLGCALSPSRPSTKKSELGDQATAGGVTLVRRFDFELYNRGLDRTRETESVVVTPGARRAKRPSSIRRSTELPWISSGAVVPEPNSDGVRSSSETSRACAGSNMP